MLSDQPLTTGPTSRTFRHTSTDRVHAQFSNSTIQRLCFRSKRSQVQTMSPRRLTGTGARARTVRRYSSGRVALSPAEGFGCTGLNRRQPWPRSFDGRKMRPIDVTIGEFRLGGTFRLVYLLPNTTTNRTTKRSKSRRSTTSRRSLSLELLRHRGLHPGASGYREGRPPVWSPRLSATLVTRGIKSPRRSRFPPPRLGDRRSARDDGVASSLRLAL